MAGQSRWPFTQGTGRGRYYCITESWAHNDITDAELGLEGNVMFRKDRIGKREEECYYISRKIYQHIVQLSEEADCNEAIWCKLVTGHTTVTIGVVYRCPNITKQNNEKIHNAISEVSKGERIIMGFLTMEILSGIHNRAQG